MSDPKRGLVPLAPLALILLFPCFACVADELGRTGPDVRRGPWTAVGVVLVLAIGVVLGGAGVLAARGSRLIGSIGGAGEVVAIAVAIGLGCGVLVESQALDAPRDVPNLAWLQRDSALLAVDAAREAGKPVLLDFTATWSPPTLRFDDDTPEHARVRVEASRFVRVHVEASDDEETIVRDLLNRFHIVGVPALIMFDRSGREAFHLEGYSSPEEVLAAMKRVE